MKKVFLIHSKKNYPKGLDGKVVYSGRWCLLSKHIKKSTESFEILTYHWDDRIKLHKDFEKIFIFYRSVLELIANQLNKFHNKNYDLRYWEIIIGPWLQDFIYVLFDRWKIIKTFKEEYKNTKKIAFIDYYDSYDAPFDYQEYQREMHDTGDLSNQIFYEILKLEKIDFLTKPLTRTYQEEFHLKHSLKRLSISYLTRIWNKVGSFFGDDKYFFIGHSLDLFPYLKIKLKLAQFPFLWRPLKEDVQKRYHMSKFREKKLSLENIDYLDSRLVNIFEKLLYKYIPIIYLEGYNDAIHTVKKSNWPIRPKIIFTSISWNSDEYFKLWSAQKVLQGSKLIVNQHGGNYGISKFNISEKHEYSICDYYISWGWSDNRKKIIPGFNLKLINKVKSQKNSKNQGVLLTQMTLPLMFYSAYSVPIGLGQWEKYFTDQKIFYDNLENEIKNEVIIRTHPKDYGQNQKSLWKSISDNIYFDNNQSFHKSIFTKKIVISSYNATTFLETMALNIPTIIFWSPEFWEMRDGSDEFFKRLKKVGIWHDSPLSASTFLNSIWLNIDEWWFSEKVQSEKNYFCKKFSNLDKSNASHTIGVLNNLNDKKWDD